MNETFCRFFRNGLVYNNNQVDFTISPCCYYSKVDAIDSSANDQNLLSSYRQKWQQDNIDDVCSACLKMEKAGGTSYRQTSFDVCDGTSDGIEFLTIAVNKKCNLACVSCGAYSSSFWYQENIRNNIDHPISIQKLHSNDRSGAITQKFLDLLATQDLSKLKYIKFGGGEPLMSDTHLEVLKLIKHPEDVVVQYTSNFSIMPSKEAYKQWERFKLVKWVASIDGVQDQFDFLRWPHNWDKLNKFAETAIKNVPGNVMFGVEHTVNPLNAFYFDNFETWFKQNFSANRYGDPTDLNVHLCTGNLGIEQTPPALRQLILDKFGKGHSITNALQQSPYRGHSRIVNYLDQVDTWRGQQWRKIFSEVQGYFNV